jgi:UDP-3-O-acyl N-acetylglucosamine deacetylase
MRRRSVKHAAEFRGITLFTGVQSRVTVKPAAAGSGIGFLRIDLPAHRPIPARVGHVVPETRRTVLALDPQDRASPSVQTVEHVMSALAGLGVTDALVEVEGPELPIGDGSALPFVEMLQAAGLAELGGAALGPIVVRERMEIEDGRGGKIVAEPREGEGLELVYHLDYGPGAPLPAQSARFVSRPGEDDYAAAIAPARTFSTLDEAKAMRKMGLFAHLTAAEMLVIGPEGPVENAYRFSDEPARHKVLDMLGDLALAGGGRPIRGRVTAWRTGHALNHAMAGRLAGL